MASTGAACANWKAETAKPLRIALNFMVIGIEDIVGRMMSRNLDQRFGVYIGIRMSLRNLGKAAKKFATMYQAVRHTPLRLGLAGSRLLDMYIPRRYVGCIPFISMVLEITE